MGRAGSGKTTAANFLASKLGYRVEHFATTLKEAAKLIWGEDALRDRGKLQWLGNAVRSEYPTAWIDSTMERIDRLSRERKMVEVRPATYQLKLVPCTVDDCRFPNEVEPLRERNFAFVRVVADEDTRVLRLQGNGKFGSREQLEDITETSLDDFEADFTVKNDGDLDTFYESLLDVLNRIRSQT